MPKPDPDRERFIPTGDQLHALVNKEAPAAENAERGLLSCIMQDHRIYPAVAEALPGNGAIAFYHPGYAALYAALSATLERGGQPDPPSLEADMRQRGFLDGVGGVAGIVEIWESEASVCAEVALERCRVVAEAHARRSMADIGARMIHNAHSTKHALDKLVDFAGRDVLGLSELIEGKGTGVGMATTADIMAGVQRDVLDPDAKPAGIPTRFPDLDRMVVGLVPGEVTVVGARPSQGKTALGLNIAANIAAKGLPVGFFSLEMSKAQLAERLLSREANVPGEDIRKRCMTSLQRENVTIASRAIAAAPLVIDDTPGMTLMQLRNRSRRMVVEHHVKVIFIDYLQLMSDPGNNSRQEEVSSLSRGIKALARELNVPVVCLSQLNRASESRSGNRPRMSDLRESGAIEQDADNIWLIHREDYYHKGDRDYQNNNTAEVIIEKQRNGPTGVVRLHWDGEVSRFSSAAREGQVEAEAVEEQMMFG